MKWFRHFCDSHDDIRIKLLIEKHGAEGYGCFYLLVEHCTRLWDGEDTNNHPIFQLTKRVMCDKFNRRWDKVKNFLNSFELLGILSLTYDGDVITLVIPIILESYHRDATSSKKRAGNWPSSGRPIPYALGLPTSCRIEGDYGFLKNPATSPPPPESDSHFSPLMVKKSRDTIGTPSNEVLPNVATPQESGRRAPPSEEGFTPQSFFDYWNQNRGPLKAAKVLNKKRIANLKKLFKQFSDAEIKEAMENLKASKFHTGRTEHNFLAGIDLFIREDAFIKALEGYDNQPHVVCREIEID